MERPFDELMTVSLFRSMPAAVELAVTTVLSPLALGVLVMAAKLMSPSSLVLSVMVTVRPSALVLIVSISPAEPSAFRLVKVCVVLPSSNWWQLDESGRRCGCPSVESCVVLLSPVRLMVTTPASLADNAGSFGIGRYRRAIGGDRRCLRRAVGSMRPGHSCRWS